MKIDDLTKILTTCIARQHMFCACIRQAFTMQHMSFLINIKTTAHLSRQNKMVSQLENHLDCFNKSNQQHINQILKWHLNTSAKNIKKMCLLFNFFLACARTYFVRNLKKVPSTLVSHWLLFSKKSSIILNIIKELQQKIRLSFVNLIKENLRYLHKHHNHFLK